MVLLSASTAFLAIYRTLLGRVPCATVLAAVISFFHSGHIMELFQNISFSYVKEFCFFYLIKGWFFAPFVLLICLPKAIHAHLWHPQCPPIIPSSLNPLLNCSASNLSYSQYWHSAALVLSLLIHSCAGPLHFLCNLCYYSDISVLLCHGLNLFHNTVKRHFAVQNFSFSSWVKVCINCRPSHFNVPVLHAPVKHWF